MQEMELASVSYVDNERLRRHVSHILKPIFQSAHLPKNHEFRCFDVGNNGLVKLSTVNFRLKRLTYVIDEKYSFLLSALQQEQIC